MRQDSLLVATSNTEYELIYCALTGAAWQIIPQGRPTPSFQFYGAACHPWRFQLPPFGTTLYDQYVRHASVEGEPTGSLRPRHRASFHVALWHVYWALLRPFICMDATVIFCSSGQASGQAYLQSNMDLIMTGAVFCKFPIESSGLLNSHKHEKRTCLPIY